ncbi:hypothetical protein, partial [Enterobacter cloacae complex sp. 2DZ2F2B]|uniref:hypothetical protein n=1 Tax=Enterobacter cloacae complex sp. 2DZ2F2B TaxID=2511984 RepID=UPI001CA4934D
NHAKVQFVNCKESSKHCADVVCNQCFSLEIPQLKAFIFVPTIGENCHVQALPLALQFLDI